MTKMQDAVTLDEVTTHLPHQPTVLGAEARQYYDIIFSYASFVICLAGIGSNVINIVVFLKQGVKDTVTLSFLVMAFSDLGSVATMLGVGLCFHPQFAMADTGYDSYDLSYILGWTHIFFARVTIGMTVFVATERLLCIVVPLKVKTLITQQRVLVFSTINCIVMLGSVAPIFYTSRLGDKFVASRNMTLIGLFFTEDRPEIDQATFAVTSVILIMGVFIYMLVSTFVLAAKLHRMAKWREAASTIKARDTGSESRDKRVIKMVVLISAIFIICFFPNVVSTLPSTFVSDYRIGGPLQVIAFMTGSFALLMEAVNSSVNIFVYFKMSAKYRESFYEVFGCNTNRKPSV